MSTSLRDLLDTVEANTRGRMESPGQELADDAVCALRHAARALHRVRDDGLARVQSLAVGELADACGVASAAWRAAYPAVG